jgi:hypothetical protein
VGAVVLLAFAMAISPFVVVTVAVYVILFSVERYLVHILPRN